MAEYHPYGFFVVFLLAAAGFGLGPILLAKAWARWVSPPKPGPIKQAIYECGLASRGRGEMPFKVEYYLYALLFLIFDVEVLFLLPFAVAFLELPAGACVAMLVFLLLLAEGLVWAWARGLLAWR